MVGCRTARGATRATRDFLIGLCVFGVLAVVVPPASHLQHGVPLAMLTDTVEAWSARSGEGALPLVAALPDAAAAKERATYNLMWSTLALVFSSLVAFNLWFFRHLRRIHGASRPRAGRPC